MFEKVVLIVGGNKGNRNELLKAALEAISGLGELTLQSTEFETEAWGGVAKGPFLNQVIEIKTTYSAFELLAFTKEIETDLGRTREEHWGDRTMDIDIIYFGNKIIDTDQLRIPHPFLAERRFVLAPLTEILPDFIHPVFGKSSQQMLEECQDKSEVWPLTER